MGNAVIVAIPREDDPVWKISSEKVPHLTILFLGPSENADIGAIAKFVEHAASVGLSRFGLDVDRRGTLGEDEADVVFFQDNWELPKLRDFRSQLLKFDPIKTAYDSVEQFDGWTPHLTLGYPESPAKPTSERIYWVQFDRIAVWTGDYKGSEFVLDNNYPMEVMMSDVTAMGRQFLAHYGVKGMKWGVRKARGAQAVSTIEKKGLTGKTKVKAKGGGGHAAAPEAVSAAIKKQKLKKSGPAALTNNELREIILRAQLEQQAKQLTTSEGSRFVQNLVKSTGQQQVQRVVAQESTRFVDEQRKRR